MPKFIYDANQTVSAVVTVNANGTAVEMTQAVTNINVKIKTVSGTTPTLSIKLQGSIDGTTYFDLCTLPTYTAVGNYQGVAVDLSVGRYRYIRPVYTVGGTSPNFNIDVKFN